MTAKTINVIIQEVFDEKGQYHQIMENILYSAGKGRYLNELVSVLAEYFLMNEKKIIKTYKSDYFRYWWARVVMNQVNSNTSQFYRENFVQINEIGDIHIEEEEENEIEEKQKQEEKYLQIEKAMKNLKVNWFDSEIFKLYYKENLSLRQIEKETGIDHCLAYISINKTRNQIKQTLNKK